MSTLKWPTKREAFRSMPGAVLVGETGFCFRWITRPPFQSHGLEGLIINLYSCLNVTPPLVIKTQVRLILCGCSSLPNSVFLGSYLKELRLALKVQVGEGYQTHLWNPLLIPFHAANPHISWPFWWVVTKLVAQ